MDLNDVEMLRVNALRGTDVITVNDLTGTATTQVAINLSGIIGGSTGDATPDTVIVNGNNGNNAIIVGMTGSTVTVNGLAAQVRVDGAEAKDRLAVNGLGGNDTINAGALTNVIAFTANGGAGNDTITGGARQGHLARRRRQRHRKRTAVMTRRFLAPASICSSGIRATATTWSRARTAPTPSSSTARTSARTSTSWPTARGHCFRNVASVTMDLERHVETIDFTMLGGADNVVVGDLTGTAATAGQYRPCRRLRRQRRRQPGRHRDGHRHQRRRRHRCSPATRRHRSP